MILEIGDFVWKKSDGETFTLNILLHRYERFIQTNSSSMYSFRGRIWVFSRVVYPISIIFNQQILSFLFHRKSEILMKSSEIVYIRIGHDLQLVTQIFIGCHPTDFTGIEFPDPLEYLIICFLGLFRQLTNRQ